MKATHVGRLKSISEILSSVGDEGASKSFIDYILKNESKERELTSFGNCDTRFFDGEMCVIDEYFTDLRDIKPEIEIPKTPFWFKDSIGDVYLLSVNKSQLWDYVLYKNNKYHKGVDYLNVKSMLNNGTWTICDAPEKVMIPWSDEDWKEWFLNDGKVIDNRHEEDDDYENTVYLIVHGITPDDEDQFYYMGEGEWLSKETFLNDFLDRHGNKFEKEA